MGDSSTVHALLLQEAQQEIASLRTELYNTRRTAEERRQALVQLTSRVQQLESQVQGLEGSLTQAQKELATLRGVDEQLAALRESAGKLQRELEASVSAKRILQGELADERQQRQVAEQAKATLESERSRLQKARAEMAAQLRVAEKAARDAEAEQLHAESEAQALRQELTMLRSGSMASPSRDGFDAVAAAAAIASMNGHMAELTEQLELERGRTAALMDSLDAARSEVEVLRMHAGAADTAAAEALKQEVAALRAQATAAQARVQQLEQQLQSTAQRLAAAEQAHAQAHAQVQAAQAAAAAASRQAADAAGAASSTPSATAPSSHQASTSQPSAAPPGSSLGLPPRPVSRDNRPFPSSDSLTALGTSGRTGSGEMLGEADLVAQLQHYQAQVQKLKHSRDKLLEEIDSQWEEMDRLANEQKATAAEAATQRQLATTWEAQAQDALVQVDKLKELLEESAAWGSAAGAQGQGLGGKSAAEVAVALQSQLLREKARAADLELGARALAAELVRAQHASVSIGRSVLPVLCGIEHRLGGMCEDAQGALQQWRRQRAQQDAAVTGSNGQGQPASVTVLGAAPQEQLQRAVL